MSYREDGHQMSADRNWARAANHSCKWLAYGGVLSAAPEGIRFTPNSFDRKVGAKEVFVPSAQIRQIGVQEPVFGLFNGAGRKRLRIDTSEGQYFFVIGGVQQVASELSTLLGRQ